MQAEELDLVETEILVEALKRRSAAVVVVMVQSLDDEREARECWWRGGLITSLGLAEYAKQRISRQFSEPSLPGD